MRFIVPAVLVLLALIHALPVVGAFGAGRLEALYGIPVAEPNLEILLRHRAVLFGIVAFLLAGAVFKPGWRSLAFGVAAVSLGSFLLLAWLVGGANPAVGNVVRVDLVAAVLCAIGVVAHRVRA